MMYIKRKIIYILLLVFCLIFTPKKVLASDNDISEKYDFDSVQEFIDDDNELDDINFKEIVSDFLSGDAQGGLKKITSYTGKLLFSEIADNFTILKKIIAIAVISAVFTNFTTVLKNSQVSDTGFTICYMVVVSLIIASFTVLSALTYTTIERVTEFMKSLLPVYTVSIGVSDGQVYAEFYYQMALVIITIIDMFCLKILLPIVNIYIVLIIADNLFHKNYLSKACSLIKNITSFSLKTMLSVVMAINVIRQMFSTINNNVGNAAATNVLGLISGMGNSSGNITKLVYGTGNILKNAIGGAGMILLSLIVLVPIIKIVVFVFSYQLTSAFLQPVSDERIVNCIDGISDGAVLMLRIVFSVSLMFIITVTIVCLRS